MTRDDLTVILRALKQWEQQQWLSEQHCRTQGSLTSAARFAEKAEEAQAVFDRLSREYQHLLGADADLFPWLEM